MHKEHRSEDWDRYKMVYREPFRELEPPQREKEIVGGTLATLVAAGMLPHNNYDETKLAAYRQAVREQFEIPWSAITPRLQRLMYAINAIAQPANMIAAGCFCGNTFICNAGAAVGPGACYTAKQLIGIEIKPHEAERAERNVRRLDPTGVARIAAADAVDFVAQFPEPIHLLYLDADGDKERGKGIYLEILQACLDKIPTGGLVLAHNSINAAKRLEHYLNFVRDEANFRASINVMIDGEGLEVSWK